MSGEKVTNILTESDAHLNNLSVKKKVDENDQIPATSSFHNQVSLLLAELNEVVESWEKNNVMEISSENTTNHIDGPQQMNIDNSQSINNDDKQPIKMYGPRQINFDDSQQIKIDGNHQIKIECEPNTSTAHQTDDFNKVICLFDKDSNSSYSGNDNNALKNLNNRAIGDWNEDNRAINSAIKDLNPNVFNGSSSSVTNDGHCSVVKHNNRTIPICNQKPEENEIKRRFYKNKYNYKCEKTTFVSRHPDPRTVLNYPRADLLNCSRGRGSEPGVLPNTSDADDPNDRNQI